MGKNQVPDPGSESGKDNPDHISEGIKNNFLGQNTVLLKFFDVDPG
jgi:hypothetical protein